MTALRRRMIEELRLRNYSPNTITVYIRCVANFTQHFRVSPDRLGPEHIRQYQLFLVQHKKVSWLLFNQTVCALRFFYHRVLHRDWMIEYIPYPRHEDKLPVVLSPAEVAAVLEATNNLKHRTILMTGARLEPIEHTALIQAPSHPCDGKPYECRAEQDDPRTMFTGQMFDKDCEAKQPDASDHCAGCVNGGGPAASNIPVQSGCLFFFDFVLLDQSCARGKDCRESQEETSCCCSKPVRDNSCQSGDNAAHQKSDCIFKGRRSAYA